MSSKTILVTGATAGIGRFTALDLARKGHRVIATGRNVAALETLRKEGDGLSLEVLRLDVNDAASVDEAARKVDELTGGRGLDVLVNNAGYGQAGPLEEVSDEALRAQFETNVFGLMRVTRAFVPAMRARGSGRIVNVGSIAGRFTFPLFGAYHASKYAVEALSDALRVELAPFGVDVSIVEPGPIRSEFSARTADDVVRRRNDRSAYAAVLARAEEIRAASDGQSVGPEVVARAIEHAALARFPRVRYVVPGRARVMLAILRALPTRLADFAMARVLGLTRKRLAARRSGEAAALA